jgi:hypothetical protein
MIFVSSALQERGINELGGYHCARGPKLLTGAAPLAHFAARVMGSNAALVCLPLKVEPNSTRHRPGCHVVRSAERREEIIQGLRIPDVHDR